MTTITSQIKQAHLNEWVEDSSVSKEITRLNVVSVSNPKEIAERLNWKCYQGSPGWWVSGVDPLTGERRKFGQFKPEVEIQFPDSDKPAKYLSGPKGSPTEGIFLDTGDRDYWKNLQADPSRLLLITEGAKKAGAGLTAELATIALTGVWNGQVDKRKLIPDLQLFAAPSRPVCLAFDSDVIVKPEVQQALIHLGKLLKKAGCIVTVAQLPAETKGMDDFIAAHGDEAFKAIVGNAIAYENWLQGLEGQVKFCGKSKRSQQPEPPKPSIIGRELAELYRDRVAWNVQSSAWYHYELEQSGVWGLLADSELQGLIQTQLDCHPELEEGYTLGYVQSITGLLKGYLGVKNWNTRASLLPFTNGVLDTSTGELLPHAPGYRFTWSLPRAHCILDTNWSTIDAWMDEAMAGKPALKQILLCWLNAVLKGRSDLQRFLHLTGPGGSGKGTFMRLAIALIGTTNNHSSTLEDWNGNRYETANAHGKRLVSFPDEDKYTRGLSKFKSLTGGDHLRAEEKHKKAFQFVYDGMTMLASNFPIFAGDTSSGMARRCLMVPFAAQVAKGKRRNLDLEFERELGALTNYVLAIPDEEVTHTLLQINDESADVTEQTWDYRMRTDSIAAWVNENVIHDPKAQTAVGSDRENVSTLFGNYWQYCQATGSKPKGLREFTPSLLELCNHTLGWSDVTKRKTMTGRVITGLRLRSEWDKDVPNPIESLSVEVESSQPMTDSTRHDDGYHDESKPLQDIGYDGYDGSNLLFNRSENLNELIQDNALNSSPIKEIANSSVIPVMTPQEAGSSCHAHPSMTDSPPVMPPETAKNVAAPAESRQKPLAVGDSVSKRYKLGWLGQVTAISGETVEVLWQGMPYPEQILKNELKPAPNIKPAKGNVSSGLGSIASTSDKSGGQGNFVFKPHLQVGS